MLGIMLVGVGGFLGSVLRYLVGGWVHRLLDNPWFPYGTLVVNLVGCLVIGFLGGLAENRQVFSPRITSICFYWYSWRIHDVFIVCLRNIGFSK